MDDKIAVSPYEQKATILRERAFFAAFITILFALAFNGALFLLDGGISLLRATQSWTETLLSGALLLLGLAVIGVTGLLVVSAWQSLRLAWKMEKEGQLSAGTVLKKILYQDGKKSFCSLVYGLDAQTRYIERIPEADYLRLNVGDPIIFRFLPEHPDIARLEKIK